VVDGVWSHDTNLPSVDDNYGGRNNTLEVGGSSNKNKQESKNKGAAASNAGKAAKPAPTVAKKKDIKNISDVPLPDYWQTRINLWDKIKKRNQETAPIPSGNPIKISLPNGKQQEGKAGITKPMDIAKSISQSLARDALIALVNGKPYDLDLPLEEDCELEIKKFDSPEGKKTFWHSSAHIMGQALERIFHCSLCVGPPLENGGFYYDMAATDEEGNFITFEPSHSDIVKQVVDKIIKEKQPFERIVLKNKRLLKCLVITNIKSN